MVCGYGTMDNKPSPGSSSERCEGLGLENVFLAFSRFVADENELGVMEPLFKTTPGGLIWGR